MTTASESKIKKGILLEKNQFIDCGGLFTHVYAGKITKIAEIFQQSDKSSQVQVLSMITWRDNLGRTPFDIAW